MKIPSLNSLKAQIEELLQLHLGLVNNKLEKFNLKYKYHIIRKLQNGNVCAWASSAKLAMQGAVFAHLLKKGMNLKDAERYSNIMYKTFVQEDRLTAIGDYLKNVPESEIKTTVLACIYKHLTNKKMQKKLSNSNSKIMELIEQHAQNAVILSMRVRIDKRKAKVI